jgi:putative DNA primase/helicase
MAVDVPRFRDVPPTSDDDAGPEASGSKRRAPIGDGAVGLAVRYVAEHCMHTDGPTLRRWRGDWYRWSAARGHYAEVGDEAIDASLFRDFKMKRPADAHDVRAALIAADDVLIDDVQLGSWIGEPAIRHDALDIAACPNGLLNLRSRSLTPATPRFFSTTSLGVKFDPRAASPQLWLAFLRQLWPNDDESIAALQEWFGYQLTPDTRQQKIMMFVGPKRSGKGTVMRVMKALLGEDSVAAPTLASLGSNFGLWPLIGKTAAIIGDARLGGRSDIAQIVERLLSLSGEDAQTIDRKHRVPWTGYLSARMTIVSNELPRFTDASDALSSRMLILELAESFYGREDTGLTERLRGELPGILLWAIEGWDRLRQRGRFVQPTASAELVNDLADLASPVAAWVRERCIRGAPHEVDCKRAFTDYQDWATGEGQQHKVTLATFGRDLKAAAQVSRVQVRDGLTRSWRYRGIRLREVGDLFEPESVTGCH